MLALTSERNFSSMARQRHHADTHPDVSISASSAEESRLPMGLFTLVTLSGVSQRNFQFSSNPFPAGSSVEGLGGKTESVWQPASTERLQMLDFVRGA